MSARYLFVETQRFSSDSFRTGRFGALAMSPTFIGIDPGLTGAVAIISPDILLPEGSYISFHDAPIGQVGNKRAFIPNLMARILFPYRNTTVKVAIEAVHSMPKQGVTSAFNFGKGLGLWIGILVGMGIPYSEIPPQRWKAAMMNGMGKDKD